MASVRKLFFPVLASLGFCFLPTAGYANSATTDSSQYGPAASFADQLAYTLLTGLEHEFAEETTGAFAPDAARGGQSAMMDAQSQAYPLFAGFGGEPRTSDNRWQWSESMGREHSFHHGGWDGWEGGRGWGEFHGHLGEIGTEPGCVSSVPESAGSVLGLTGLSAVILLAGVTRRRRTAAALAMGTSLQMQRVA